MRRFFLLVVWPLLAWAATPLDAQQPVTPPAQAAPIDSFEVVGHRPFPYQVDGDYLGETRRLRFQHRPEVMDLVLPLRP